MKGDTADISARQMASERENVTYGAPFPGAVTIERFFRMDDLPSPDDRPIAHTLLVLSVVQAILGFIALAIDMAGEGFLVPQHILCALAILVVSAIPAFVIRTGRISTAAWVFNLTISIVVFLLCLLSAGIMSASAPILLLPVIWSWSTLGKRGALAICVLTVLEMFALIWWSISGYAPHNVTELGGLPPAVGLGLILLLVAFSGTVSGYVGYRNNQIHKEHLIRARDEAQKANRAKAEFIASIAHEVRTPLTGLMGMLELLARENLQDSHQEMAGTARSSARNILNLINDLLDLSKIEVGELRLLPEPTDVAALVNETAREFKSAAEEKDLELTVRITGEPVWLLLDPLRLRQIVSNYISNAVKFTETGRICVSLTTSDLANGDVTLRLSVEDTGPGVPLSQRNMIFGRFTQIDSVQRAKYNGTGLGLAIVSDLAILLGGKTWVESEETKGSVFFFEGQFKRTSPLDLPRLSSSDSDRADATILITDDSLGNQRVLSRYLQGLGYTTHAVENGSDAMMALLKQKIDLIFLDHFMPVKDGLQTLRDIRALPDPDLKNVPVIAMSADLPEADMKHWVDAGVDGVISKPIDFPALDATIQRVLGAGQRSR